MPVTTLPLKRIRGGSVLTSFSYIDIVQGKAITNMYAGDATTNNFLSTERFYSNNIVTSATGNPDAAAIDMDFDSTFGLPRVVEGIALVQVPISVVVGTANTHTCKVTVYVRKWNGTTEIELVNKQSDTITQAGSGTTSKIVCVELDIPKTRFRSGESLRLTCVVNRGGSPATSCTVYLGHDPKDRELAGVFDSTVGVPSTLIFPVPFVVSDL